MKNPLIKILKLMLCFLAVVVIICLIIFIDDLRTKSDANYTDALSGMSVGVVEGWESDYLLESRDDITLKRYSEVADLVMALRYNQVNAIAVDEITLALLEMNVDGIFDTGISLYSTEYALYVEKENEENLKMVNDFISEFKKSDDYKDFCEHYSDIDWINGDNYTEMTGTEKPIKVGFIPEYYPFSFIDSNGTIKGNEIEFCIQMANYYNRKLEFIRETPETSLMDLSAGKIDVVVASITTAYRYETESPVSKISMSDGYIDSRIRCIVSSGHMTMKNTEHYY